jgi:hypothetical protein
MSIRDAGTTIRPSSTAVLTIDSEDRFANYVEKRTALDDPKAYNYSPYDFALIKNGVLVNGYMTRLAVSEVVFPWVIPNISATTQSIKYTYEISGGGFITDFLTLNIGFYTPHQLAAAITTQLNADVPLLSFTMTYGSPIIPGSTGGVPAFSYSVPIANTISFQPLVAGDVVGVGAKPWTFPPTTKQLFDLLGFTDTNTEPNFELSGQATFAQGTRYVDIVCPLLTANQGLPDATSQAISDSALCRIYLGDITTSNVANEGDALFAPPGTEPTIIYRQFATPKQIAWNAIQPIQGRLRFQVLDDNGQVLTQLFAPPWAEAFPLTIPYVSSADWSMTLLLSEN